MKPARKDSSPKTVKLHVTKLLALDDVEAFGKPVFDICEDQAAVTLEIGTDLDLCAY